LDGSYRHSSSKKIQRPELIDGCKKESKCRDYIQSVAIKKRGDFWKKLKGEREVLTNDTFSYTRSRNKGYADIE